MPLKSGSYLKDVRNQYEEFPYPPRNPADETQRLLVSYPSSIDCINHYCFAGRKDLRQNSRILVPGGGTGDCLIYLAEQLRGSDSELVYLDMTAASMEIARERARIRGLENITWIHDSILNIPTLDLGKFDFITCSGVLHHLEDPQAGLDALASVLNESGSIFLMVYATYGRTAVYQMQDLMRRINVNADSPEEKVHNTKSILNNLPSYNWFNFNKNLFLDLKSDEGIYDLLLHSQDRSYTVPELYDYVETSGLTLNTLINLDTPLGNHVFEPATFIKDRALLDKVSQLPFRERAAISELLFGQILKQNCFMAFKDKLPAQFDDEMIPDFSVNFKRRLSEEKKQYLSAAGTINITELIKISRTPNLANLFSAIDGHASIQSIVESVATSSGHSGTQQTIRQEFKNWFKVMLDTGNMYLRAPGISQFNGYDELQNI